MFYPFFFFFSKSVVKIFQVAEMRELSSGSVVKKCILGSFPLVFKTERISSKESSCSAGAYYENENSGKLVT